MMKFSIQKRAQVIFSSIENICVLIVHEWKKGKEETITKLLYISLYRSLQILVDVCA